MLDIREIQVDCDECGTLTEFRITQDIVKIRGQLVTVEQMPVYLCPNCGERYYHGPFILALERSLAEKVAA